MNSLAPILSRCLLRWAPGGGRLGLARSKNAVVPFRNSFKSNHGQCMQMSLHPWHQNGCDLNVTFIYKSKVMAKRHKYVEHNLSIT